MKKIIRIWVLLSIFLLIALFYQNASAEESVRDILRKNLQPGNNFYTCQQRISGFAEFQLLSRRETRAGIYELWSITILGMSCYRVFVVNGIIESITEHPALSK